MNSPTPDQLDQSLPGGSFESSLHDSVCNQDWNPLLLSLSTDAWYLKRDVASWKGLHLGKWQNPCLGLPESNGNTGATLWDVEDLEHLWPMKEQPQPWLKECACCLFQLAKWSISNTQSIIHAAKCSHRTTTCDVKILVWGQDAHVLKSKRWPVSTSKKTVFPSGLGRAASTKPTQGQPSTAPGGRNDHRSSFWEWTVTCQNGRS